MVGENDDARSFISTFIKNLSVCQEVMAVLVKYICRSAWFVFCILSCYLSNTETACSNDGILYGHTCPYSYRGTNWSELYRSIYNTPFKADLCDAERSILPNTATFNFVEEIISTLGWKHLIVLVQAKSDFGVDSLICKLHRKGTLTILHRLNIGEDFTDLISKTRDPYAYVVVFGNDPFLRYISITADEYDKKHENFRRTALCMRSFWIFVSLSKLPISQNIWQNFSLDNVLLITSRLDIFTLMWRQSTRELQKLNYDTFGLSGVDIFPNAKLGFNGRELLTTALTWKGYVETADNNGHVTISGGYCGDIIRILSEKLNFTHKVVKPPDGEWGNFVNKSWTGMIGQLHRREIDIAMVPLTLQEARAEVVDFTIPIYYSHSSLLLRRPDPDGVKWRIFLNPFPASVYLVLCLVLMFSSIFVYLTEKYSPRSKNKSPYLVAFCDVILYFYGALFLQVAEQVPTLSSSRVFAGFFLICCVSMSAVYTGSLVASMAVARTPKIAIQTLDELVNQNEYKWGYNKGTFRDLAFKTSPLETQKRVYEGVHKFFKEDKGVMAKTTASHLNKVKNEKYVYISDVNHLLRISMDDCKLAVATDRFLPDAGAFALPKNSWLTDIFTEKLHRLQDNGFLAKLLQSYKPEDLCSSASCLRKEMVQLTDMQSAFYVTLIGLFLAALSLCIEHVVHSTKGSSCQNNLRIDIGNKRWFV